MVRAILAGTKTQTRRVLNPQPNPSAYVQRITPHDLDEGGFGFFDEERDYRARYRPGDTLWVRETWRMAQWGSPIYRADKERSMGMDEYSDRHKWRPSIFMPRSASRITLRVVGVRVERVKDITEADAKAEGAEPADCCHAYYHGFGKLWESINGPRGYGWDANPWVWVVNFARI